MVTRSSASTPSHNAEKVAQVATLWNRYEKYLFKMARKISGNGQDADDLLGQTADRVLSSTGSFRSEGSFLGWTLRIMSNLWIDQLRKRSRSAALSLDATLPGCDTPLAYQIPDPSPGPLEIVIRNERGQEVWQALDWLPDRYRTAVVLRHLEQLSYAEVAALTDTPIGTVRSRLHRGLRLLREMLAPQA